MVKRQSFQVLVVNKFEPNLLHIEDSTVTDFNGLSHMGEGFIHLFQQINFH